MSSLKRFDKEEYEQLVESIYDFQISDRFSNSDSDMEHVMEILTQIRKIEIDNNLPHHFYSDDYEGEEDSESEYEEENKSDEASRDEESS